MREGRLSAQVNDRVIGLEIDLVLGMDLGLGLDLVRSYLLDDSFWLLVVSKLDLGLVPIY